MPYKLNSLTGKFDFYQDEALSVKYNNTNSGLTAVNVQNAIDEIIVPNYKQSTYTNFQVSNKTITTQNFGSGGSVAVGFSIPKKVRLNTAQIEVTGISTNPTSAQFALYDVVNGEPKNQLYLFNYSIVATGIYQFTFPPNTFLNPGIYAWATNQTIIIGYRCITSPDNVFGLINTISANNIMITGKNSTSGLTNPFIVSSNSFALVPNCIFNITVP